MVVLSIIVLGQVIKISIKLGSNIAIIFAMLSALDKDAASFRSDPPETEGAYVSDQVSLTHDCPEPVSRELEDWVDKYLAACSLDRRKVQHLRMAARLTLSPDGSLAAPHVMLIHFRVKSDQFERAIAGKRKLPLTAGEFWHYVEIQSPITNTVMPDGTPEWDVMPFVRTVEHLAGEPFDALEWRLLAADEKEARGSGWMRPHVRPMRIWRGPADFEMPFTVTDEFYVLGDWETGEVYIVPPN